MCLKKSKLFGLKILILSSVVVLLVSCKNLQKVEVVTTENIVVEKFQPTGEPLEKVKPDTVVIELKVEDSQGASAVKRIKHIVQVIDKDKLYDDLNTWKAAVGTNKSFLRHPSFQFVESNPSLPNVLLIGNSISIGYTSFVRESLTGKCNVYRIPENGGDTKKGLEKLDYWLSSKKWDVIHFNFGLHDLKKLLNNKLDVNGKYVASKKVYKQNLDKIVKQLIKTNARLIWATTSAVPEGAEGRIKGDEIVYNKVALDVMNANKCISIDDQYSLTMEYPEEQRPANVHFFDEGKKRQAEQVAKSILETLK